MPDVPKNFEGEERDDVRKKSKLERLKNWGRLLLIAALTTGAAISANAADFKAVVKKGQFEEMIKDAQRGIEKADKKIKESRRKQKEGRNKIAKITKEIKGIEDDILALLEEEGF